MTVNFNKASLLIFNMQMEIIPLLENSALLTHNCIWLAHLFKTLNLPIGLIEHEKLGKLASSLVEIAPEATILTKHYFSITKHQPILHYIEHLNRKQIIIAGAESHVCIYQSVVDLLDSGYEVFVLSDSISARNRKDNDSALMRLNKTDCQLITQEMLFFELLEQSERPDYLNLALTFLDGRYIR